MTPSSKLANSADSVNEGAPATLPSMDAACDFIRSLGIASKEAMVAEAARSRDIRVLHMLLHAGVFDVRSLQGHAEHVPFTIPPFHESAFQTIAALACVGQGATVGTAAKLPGSSNCEPNPDGLITSGSHCWRLLDSDASATKASLGQMAQFLSDRVDDLVDEVDRRRPEPQKPFSGKDTRKSLSMQPVDLSFKRFNYAVLCTLNVLLSASAMMGNARLADKICRALVRNQPGDNVFEHLRTSATPQGFFGENRTHMEYRVAPAALALQMGELGVFDVLMSHGFSPLTSPVYMRNLLTQSNSEGVPVLVLNPGPAENQFLKDMMTLESVFSLSLPFASTEKVLGLLKVEAGGESKGFHKSSKKAVGSWAHRLLTDFKKIGGGLANGASTDMIDLALNSGAFHLQRSASYDLAVQCGLPVLIKELNQASYWSSFTKEANPILMALEILVCQPSAGGVAKGELKNDFNRFSKTCLLTMTQAVEAGRTDFFQGSSYTKPGPLGSPQVVHIDLLSMCVRAAWPEGVQFCMDQGADPHFSRGSPDFSPDSSAFEIAGHLKNSQILLIIQSNLARREARKVFDEIRLERNCAVARP